MPQPTSTQIKETPGASVMTRRRLLAGAALFATPAVQASISNDAAKFEVWDLHCHLAGFEGNSPADKAAEMMRFADRMGVDRLCVYMGYPMLYDPKPDEMRTQNNQVIAGLEKWHHRAFGFVYLNPNYLDASLQEFDRCVRNGSMVGVKLWVAKRAASRELDAIVERAAAAHAIIFQHTWFKVGGNLPGESTPLDVAELARRHPSVSIICGHTGGDWERGIRAVRDLPNVYLDLAGSDPTAGYVEMAVREAGADRVLYGSDIGGRSFASQLAKVMDADISDAARRLILSGNLKRLMTPILKSRGINI